MNEPEDLTPQGAVQIATEITGEIKAALDILLLNVELLASMTAGADLGALSEPDPLQDALDAAWAVTCDMPDTRASRALFANELRRRGVGKVS